MVVHEDDGTKEAFTMLNKLVPSFSDDYQDISFSLKL